MTEPDTPTTSPPPHGWELFKTVVGDLARPVGLLITSIGAALATVIVALKIGPDAAAAAIFIGAVYTGLAALWAAKSWENSQSGKHAATVEVAKAAGPTTP